jgi:hypothetical protein
MKNLVIIDSYEWEGYSEEDILDYSWSYKPMANMELVCLDDSGKPSSIPAEDWVVKGETYTVKEILHQHSPEGVPSSHFKFLSSNCEDEYILIIEGVEINKYGFTGLKAKRFGFKNGNKVWKKNSSKGVLKLIESDVKNKEAEIKKENKKENYTKNRNDKWRSDAKPKKVKPISEAMPEPRNSRGVIRVRGK